MKEYYIKKRLTLSAAWNNCRMSTRSMSTRECCI